MSIETRTTHYSNDRRIVTVRLSAPAPREGESAEAADEQVALVESERENEQAWSRPVVNFHASNRGPNFSRGEWETLKREVDAAFDFFERTWPLDACKTGVEP